MHAPAPSSEREGFRGKFVRFGATLLALAIHVALTMIIALWQIGRVVRRYPLAVVKVWLPRKEPSPFEPTDGKHFQNVTHNQFAVPRNIHWISDGSEIGKVIVQAEQARPSRRVHAIGSGHSFSDAAVGDDVLLHLHGWKAPLDLSEHRLVPNVDRSVLVRVASGITIRELNRYLKTQHLAMPNLGGYDGQTLAGAVSTGTHGSGHTLGPLSDCVRSLDLVTEGGTILRIEPKNGISDPTVHAKEVPEVELRQDDDLFYSVVVAMGCMGVVHSYVLEVCNEYILAEHREVLEWAALKEKLLKGDFRPKKVEAQGKPIRHFEFLVSPYRKRGRRFCLATYRWKEDELPSEHRDRTRAYIASLFTSIREFDDIYALGLTVWPGLSPWVIDQQVKSLKDGLYVDESYRVLHLGDANYVPAYSSELAFSMDEPDPETGAPRYVAALERLFTLADEQARQGRYHNVPVSVRFVEKSPHLLALSHGRRSAIFELPMLARVPGGWDLLRFYERVLFNEFGARAHWGQANFIVGADRICASYGKAFETWLMVHAKLCPRGTFDNSFSERMGVRALSRAMDRKPIC